jgi:hypothetical protein
MTGNVAHVAISKVALAREAKKATKLLLGKSVSRVWRHRPSAIAVEFKDGTRLFVDKNKFGLELSITRK